MLSKQWVCVVWAVLCLCGVGLGGVNEAQGQAATDGSGLAKRPNIIFVFSDDHAQQAIGAYGSVINETPNIDRLAQSGVVFTNSFCTNAICGPSRASILTGLHSMANGFKDNGDRFDGDQQTFPKLLHASGYATAMIGKWHLGSTPQGFDHWMILPGQGDYYNPDFNTPEGRVRKQGYCTDIITDEAIAWLENGRDKDKPFLLMCQQKAPHRSWMPGPEELDLYKDVTIPEPDTLFDDYEGRGPAAGDQEMTIANHMYFAHDLFCPMEKDETWYRGYEGQVRRMDAEQKALWDATFEKDNQWLRANIDQMSKDEITRWKYQRYIKNYLRCVAGVDKSVGQILDYLDAHPDLKENTIVVYSSDQGFYLGEHGWYDKRWMYEESFRMPLIMRWPGVVKPGTREGALVQNIDYGPTFLAAAGVDAETPMHGQSLLPLVRGEAEDLRDALYFRFYESQGVHKVAAHYGVRTKRYTLMHFFEPRYGYWELYDLEKDPKQLHSVFDDPAYADVVKQLQAKLKELRVQFNEQ